MGDLRKAIEAEERQAQAWRAKRDDLLAELEESADLPGWCWPRVMAVLERLDGLPASAQWASVRFLQCVRWRGADMFPSGGRQASMLDDLEPQKAAVGCPCGGDTEPVVTRRTLGRFYRVGRCGSCRGPVVEWSGESPL